jgi:hypothetical protein
MNQSPKPSEVNKSQCEALDCNAKATVQVHVKAGHHGLISLSLCNGCVNKFEVEGQVGQVTTQANHSTASQVSIRTSDTHYNVIRQTPR